MARFAVNAVIAAIRAAGGTVWYMLARNEGHGFAKKENRDYYRAAAMLFLERNLSERDPSSTELPAVPR